MAEKEFFYGTSLSLESMKVIAESIGVDNLPDDAAKDLAEDVSCRLKHIIQDAAKFMRHGNRRKLLPYDINRALKIKNLEPILGFNGKEHIQFQSKGNTDRVVHFIEEKKLDLQEIISQASEESFKKLPLDVTLTVHWLAIDGIQPDVPENPALIKPEIINSDSSNDELNVKALPKIKELGELIKRPQKLRRVEMVQVKELTANELSAEQQLYYQKITEACMSNNEKLRVIALRSLSVDPGLHEILARMCTFITEGVKVNVVERNLSFLIYLMRMMKALLDNPNLYLGKYLHEIIPTIATCLVAQQLSVRPEIDNHWAIREFASRALAKICSNFNNSANNIQMRIFEMLSQALTNNNTSLASLYGAIVGLCALGPEAIKNSVIPNIKFISKRIDIVLEGEVSLSDSIAAGRVKDALLKTVIPVLKVERSPPDFLEEYKQDYGSLGQILCSSIAFSRSQTFKTVINANQQRSFSINKNQN